MALLESGADARALKSNSNIHPYVEYCSQVKVRKSNHKIMTFVEAEKNEVHL